MKKTLLGFVAGVALMMVPFSASALQMMSKDSLKAATGQAGVSIGADDITLIQIKTGSTSYIDSDGYHPELGLGGGMVTITDNGSTTMTTVNTIFGLNPNDVNAFDTSLTVDESDVKTFDYTSLTGIVGTEAAAFAASYAPSALTIDIGILPGPSYVHRLQMLAAGETVVGNETIVGIAIGLPTIEINQVKNSSGKSISLSAYNANAALDVVNDGNELIQIAYTEKTSRTALLGGSVYVWAH